MMEAQGCHPDDEQVEQYALGTLAGTETAAFEQHVLVCPDCQDRLAEMDAVVQGMQAEARVRRASALSRRSTAGTCAF